MTFEERRRDWEHRLEDILIEIGKETDDNGLRIFSDTSQVVCAFINLMSNLESNRKSKNYFIKPYNGVEE